MDGPGLEGGYCLEPHNLADHGSAYYVGANEWNDAEVKTSSRNRVSVSNNENQQIGIRVNGGNLIYGPFTYSSSNVKRFYVYIKDANGKQIDNWSTCDANGNGLDLQDGNDNGTNKTFYITGPKSIWANGISKLEIEGIGTRIDVYTTKHWGHGLYRINNLDTQLTQANQTEYRGSTTRDVDVDESQKVKWTKFDGIMEIEKVDTDNANTKLANVEFQVTGPNNYNQKVKTGTDGKIRIENLAPGTYTVKETSMPHYGYNATASANVAVKAGQLVTTTIKNTKQTGNLRIHKQNEDNGKALSGFSFKISNSKGKYIIAVAKTGPKGEEEEQKEVKQKILLTDQRTTTDPNKATTFTTDSNGNIDIYNMWIDTYKITETSVGNNIYFEVDGNYISWSSNRGSGKGNTATVEVGRQTSTNTSNTSSGKLNVVTIKNRQKYVDLSGLVWDDTPADDGKETGRNGIYRANDEDADKLLKNVTVNLKEGNTVIKSMDTVVGKAVLGAGEHTYKFERVQIDKLNQYHIEFVYNGMAYESVDLKGLTQWNTSKAAEGNARQEFNNKFKVITNNNANGDAGNIALRYDGIIDHRSDLNYEITNGNKAYGYDGATLPINYVANKYIITSTTANAYNGNLDKVKSPAAIRKDGTTEIQNINLGVYKREQPDISIKKDIKNVKILVNGKGQIYEYDKRFSHMNESAGDGYDLGVKFGNKYGKMKYTRPIYKADVMFTSDDKNRELQVYLTYAIGIRNNSSNLSAEINEIVDFYDKRYENAEIKVGTGIDENTATITNEIDFNDLRDRYTINSTNREMIADVKGQYNQMEIPFVNRNGENILGRLEKQTSKTIYVQFKLSRELVYEILGEEGKTQEPLDNVTEITSYSIFDENGAVYAGIDQNSNPGNAIPATESYPANRDTYEADTDGAPSLRLEYNVERTITGNVFEDLPIQDLLNSGIRQGNGQLDTGEPGIQKVKVELLRKEARTDGTYGDWEVKPEYTTTTDANGSYTISNFAAGDYVIRYTWGGKEHIVVADGEKKYTAQNYKATIYNDEAHEGDRWYQSLTPRYSDAKDTYDDTDKNKLIPGSIADTRESIDQDLSDPNEIKHNTETELDTNKVMVSETKEMAIDVEYNPTEVYNPSAKPDERPSEGQTQGEEDTFGVNRQHQMQNLDFGIIERPRQNYKLLKKINHVKLTLANGQVLIDVDIKDDYSKDPEDAPCIKSLAPLPSTGDSEETARNGVVSIEMDNEILQGSTLQVTYGLSVQNTSEVDYANKLFYTYGNTKTGTAVNRNPVTITVKQITDYLDKEWAVNENESTFQRYSWDKKTREDIRNDITGEVYNGRETKINDRIILQTEYLSGQRLERTQTSDPVILTATKVLTTINDSDVELDNEAEITRITKTGGGLLTIADPEDPTKTKTITPGNYIPGTGYKVETEPDDDVAQTVTVTPNTGENMNYILPISIGIGALAILGVGVILIKKTLWGSKNIFK